MDATPTSPAIPTDASESLKQLRALVHVIALSLLILTGTFLVFLYRQVVSVRKSTSELANYIGEYERSNAPELIASVHRKFAEYRQQNPDFAPFYGRYFGTNDPPPVPVRAATEETNQTRIAPIPAE